MNKEFKKTLMKYIKETQHANYKNSKGLKFVNEEDFKKEGQTFEKLVLMKKDLKKEEVECIPFFFEKYNDYTFAEIEKIVGNNISLKRQEYSILEKKYNIFREENIIRGLIDKKDNVVLYGPKGSISYENATTFSLQIALAISIGYPVFLCPTEKSKVLYINNSLNNEDFSYLLETQIKGKENFKKYADNFIPLNIDTNYNFIENKESLKNFVEEINPDIIFFNDMDLICRATGEKDLTSLIKFLSGDRAIVMVYSENSENIKKIENEAKIIIGLKKDKNSLILKNENSAFITWGSVYFDYKKLMFYTTEINKSFYPIEEKEGQLIPDIKDYGLNPPLP